MVVQPKLKSVLYFIIITLFLSMVILPFTTLVASAEAYKIEVSLPGMPDSVSDPGAYIRYLFIFGVSLAGFLAVGMIIYGGVKYMLAASVGSTQDAKDKILGALGGVALIMCSYLLLYTIDPSLTNLSPGTLKKTQPVTNSSTTSSTTDSISFVCKSNDPYETAGMRTYYTGADAETKCQTECSKKTGSKVTYWCEKR
jgi:hypothetical protein